MKLYEAARRDEYRRQVQAHRLEQWRDGLRLVLLAFFGLFLLAVLGVM